MDALNTAYAIKSAMKAGKKSAKPENFLQARSRFINITANKPFQDAAGRIAPLYRDVPLNTREYLQKFFHRNISSEKRSADNMDVEQAMVPVEQKPRPTPLSPKGKRQKIGV